MKQKWLKFRMSMDAFCAVAFPIYSVIETNLFMRIADIVLAFLFALDGVKSIKEYRKKN